MVVEGDAVQVTDDEVLQRLATAWTTKWDGRWQFQVQGGVFQNEVEEGAALVFKVTPTTLYAYSEATPSAPPVTNSEEHVIPHEHRFSNGCGTAETAGGSAPRDTWSQTVRRFHPGCCHWTRTLAPVFPLVLPYRGRPAFTAGRSRSDCSGHRRVAVDAHRRQSD